MTAAAVSFSSNSKLLTKTVTLVLRSLLWFRRFAGLTIGNGSRKKIIESKAAAWLRSEEPASVKISIGAATGAAEHWENSDVFPVASVAVAVTTWFGKIVCVNATSKETLPLESVLTVPKPSHRSPSPYPVGSQVLLE